MEQDILIYVDDKERLDASAAANSFAQRDVKNRAYINTLGAELAMKYLVSENIDVSNAKNIHSIKKILEETDIADIMLPNIHIDVRVVFDENVIFIPKSHFEYELTPDIYLVFNLSKDHEFVKFLGFFEPQLINKNNANSEYYFIEKEKLSPALDLINYINSHHGSTNKELSDEDFEISENYIVSMSDNDISEADKKYLLKQLTKCAELRDRFIEYENFETLSYKAMHDPMIEKQECAPAIEDTIDMLDMEEFSTEDNLIEDPVLEDLPIEEEVQMTEEIINEQPENELLSLDENIVQLDETETLQEEPVMDTINFEELDIPEPSNTVEEPITESISLDEVEIPDTIETFEESELETISLDDIEISQENIIDEPVAEMLSQDAIEQLQTEEPIISDIPEDIVPLDSIETLTTEVLPIEEPTMLFEELSEPIIEEPAKDDAIHIDDIIEPIAEEPPVIDDIIENLPFENPEEAPKTEEPSFGKNLLENLSAENDEIVEIQDLPDYQQSTDELSSDDLLSQIDDVISASSTADVPIDEEEISANSIDDLLDETNDLNVLYNEETPAEQQPVMPEPVEEPLPQVPGSALYNKKSTDKKSLITTGALIAILAAASAFYFIKPKDNTADIEPLSVNNETPAPQQATADDILTSNTPQTPIKKDVETTKPVVKELKNNPPKPVKSESYLDVNKLVWDVPDTLSYSPKMQSYLRTAGKSIKLSLSADLLLATEYAYTNQVKVSLKLNKNGAVQDARILSGSGSTQIDNIVLQSVKDTLNVVKPPVDEIKTPDFNLNLIIYF